ncbi:MAG TPA: hypothetical protein VF072_06580 [Thermoleophilaceae bacterium]
MEEYLRPGEEMLHVTIVQAKGMIGSAVAGGALGQAVMGKRRDRESAEQADAGGLRTASKMGLAITSDRLLLARAGGAMTLKAQELLSEVAIAEVDSLEVAKGKIGNPVTITIRGESIEVVAPKATNTDKLVSAFQQAKAGSPSAA